MTRFDHEGRLGRLDTLMDEARIDAVLLSVGSDLPYFTGYEAMPSERLTMLVARRGARPMLFVPELEAARVEAGAFELVTWGETEDPISKVAEAIRGAARVAVGDHTWSVFLLGLQRESPGTEWGPASILTRQLRMRKDAAELEALRRAAHGVDRVLARIPQEVGFAGRTELEVARDLARMTVEEGHEVASFGIVGSGPNGASPHHEAGERVIAPGDIVVCDFGGRVAGYFSDVTRTFTVGEPSPARSEVHAVVLAANTAGRAVVAPGVPCQEVDRAARRVIVEAGYGQYFIHRTGHGIGLETHEHPYMVEGDVTLLEPGMTFSVEPGIYLPGEFGVRIEDIVACTDTGIEDLNQAERALVVVD